MRVAFATLWLVASAAVYIAFAHLLQGYSLLLVAAVALIAKAGPFMAPNAVFELVRLRMKSWLLVAIVSYAGFVLYFLALAAIF